MAVHMRNGIQYGGIPNGTVKGVNPSTVPTTVKQLNQIGTVGNIAPVTIPSAVKFSNGDTLETAIGSVATIETSPAVATHAVGDYVFYNGQMYKVIAAIAVGETLTVDTNIEATSVGAELTALNNGLTQVIIAREYTISLVQNANVSPFRYYGQVFADSISGYTPICAQVIGRSTTTNGMVQSTFNAHEFHVYTYNSWAASEGIKLRVIYLKTS